MAPRRRSSWRVAIAAALLVTTPLVLVLRGRSLEWGDVLPDNGDIDAGASHDANLRALAHLRVYVISQSRLPGSVDPRIVHLLSRLRYNARYPTASLVSVEEHRVAVGEPLDLGSWGNWDLRVVVESVHESGEYTVREMVRSSGSETSWGRFEPRLLAPGHPHVTRPPSSFPPDTFLTIVGIEHGADPPP